MAQNVQGVAFLVKCTSCKDGMMHFGGTEFECIRCNGHGKFIQPVTEKEMQQHLERIKK